MQKKRGLDQNLVRFVVFSVPSSSVGVLSAYTKLDIRLTQKKKKWDFGFDVWNRVSDG